MVLSAGKPGKPSGDEMMRCKQRLLVDTSIGRANSFSLSASMRCIRGEGKT
jgi:hypothetical protein